MMQAGELWNLGVILYVLYQGEYPFNGFSDKDIISEIVNKPNVWRPSWKEGINEQVKNFLLILLDSSPYKRADKASILNDPYILLHQTPKDMLGSKRVLINNVPLVFNIYAKESFVEALFTYLGTKNYLQRAFSKLLDGMRIIDPKKNMLVSLDVLNKALSTYFGDEYSYKLNL